MSYVEILEVVSLLEIETSIQNTINNITIEKLENNTVEINSGSNIVLASDIIGLDSYIDNFLDSAELDCGTP